MCICNLAIRLGQELGDPGYDFRQEHEICPFYKTSEPVLRLSKPPIKWTFGVLLPTAVRWMLATLLHLLPSLRMNGAVLLLLPWPARGQLLALPLTFMNLASYT